MRALLILLLAIGWLHTGSAQDTTNIVSDEDLKLLQTNEDSMRYLGRQVLQNRTKEVRIASSDQLAQLLKASLEIENSFTYTFDSILHVSILYPDDSTFRIFTWQLYVAPNEYRYAGLIQKNEPQSELFALSDRSASIFFPDNMTVSSSNWFGALYYNLKQINTSSGTYYTLFGLDNNSMWVKRKIIDVLYFTEEGKPQFGSPIFHAINDRQQAETKYRIILDYSAEGSISCNYSDEYGLIIFDNLIPIGGSHEGQGVMQVSDGSYRGYKFDGEKWVFVEKVFNDFQAEAPREKAVLDKRKDGLFGPRRKRNK
jgi:hypothetical protein